MSLFEYRIKNKNLLVLETALLTPKSGIIDSAKKINDIS